MSTDKNLLKIQQWLESLKHSDTVNLRDDDTRSDEEIRALREAAQQRANDASFIQGLGLDARRSLVEQLASSDLREQLGQLDPMGLNAGFRNLVASFSASPTLSDGAASATTETSSDDTEAGEIDAVERLVAGLTNLYAACRPIDGLDRHWLLTCLAQSAYPKAWQAFADAMVNDPPTDSRHAIEAMIPLWRTETGPHDSIFPRLLEALEQPVIAPLVLDLANFWFRSGRVSPHPAANHLPALTGLLGQLVERLEGFEQQSQRRGVDDLGVAKQVTESVSLAASLCDTVALNGHKDAMGKLYRMLELRHRRLRIEAAAALARFGEEAGIEALADAATQPLIRLRAIEYARELNLTDKIPAEHRSPLARAEAELVVRLAEPDLFGIPPLSIELVDQTTLHWPSYDEPRDCYLFRYHYRFAQGDFANYGLVGPVAHAFAGDLTSLPLGDVYGVFAGWHAEHPELRRFAVDVSTNLDGLTVSQLCQQFAAEGFDNVTPAFAGSYFGDELLVAQATKQGVSGIIVGNQRSLHWRPHPSPQRPLDPEIVYSMITGRDMLNRFNDGFEDYDRDPA